MKRILACGIGVWLCVAFSSHAAQTARATFFCLSVRFHQGVFHGLGGDDVTLDLSLINLDSLDDPASPKNGELAPTFSDPFADPPVPDHYSFFVLYDTLVDDVVMIGEIDLFTPDFTDVNGNGFDDFFEVSEVGSGTSAGAYDNFIGNKGSVRASWSRPAGSKDGTYAIEFGSGQTSLGTYRGTFEILEYTGPLSYTPGTTNVTGTVNLLQTGATDTLLAGPVEFAKTPTNRFDELTLLREVWTNASSQPLNITNYDCCSRDLFLETNYYGFVDLEDGDLNTSDQDYIYWLMSIDDVNDSDGDGIPDFSDDPGSGTVPPTLLLSLGSTNLALSISGAIGRTVEIQEILSLSQSNWLSVSSFVPTNDPQVVPLPRPTEGTKFWRLRVP